MVGEEMENSPQPFTFLAATLNWYPILEAKLSTRKSSCCTQSLTVDHSSSPMYK